MSNTDWLDNELSLLKRGHNRDTIKDLQHAKQAILGYIKQAIGENDPTDKPGAATYLTNLDRNQLRDELRTALGIKEGQA